jgi:2-(1,2-epoxy-1,2-dihydrophenyl)acetyl-CoA isomerase
MSYDTIIYERHDGIARLILNRPDRLNALLTKSYLEIRDVLDRIARDGAVRALLLTGKGKAFCVGKDLEERRATPNAEPQDLGESLEERVNPIIKAIVDLRIPVLCAVNGAAAGVGASLVFACDIVVARRSARFVPAFTRVGLLPDAGASWWLPRLAGQARALGMMLAGDPIDADVAEAWGLIWRAIPDEEFDADVEALIKKLAASAPMAIAATKKLMRNGYDSLDEQLIHEAQMQRTLGFSEDHREAVSAFLEKRPAHFHNR